MSNYVDQVQAVRQRPGMYLKAYSRQDVGELTCALLRVFTAFHVFEPHRLDLAVTGSNGLSLAAFGRWTPGLVVSGGSVPSKDVAIWIFDNWRRALAAQADHATEERFQQFYTLGELATVILLAHHASVQTTLDGHVVAHSYRDGYLEEQAVEVVATPTLDRPVCWLAIDLDTTIFDKSQISFSDTQRAVSGFIEQHASEFAFEANSANGRITVSKS